MEFLEAEVMKNFLATLEREHQVKNNRVIHILLSQMGAGFSVGSVVHGQSGFAQSSNDVLSKTSLVFNEEYTHSQALTHCLKGCLSAGFDSKKIGLGVTLL
jgi:hypothetical protein